MTAYSIFSQTLYAEGHGWYTGWGIEARENGAVAARVEDVTDDEAYAARLAAVLNREGAELVHLFDVLEDFLSVPDAKNALLG